MTHGRPHPDRTLEVPGLARVEGEGALRVRIAGGAVTEVVLNIFEPPRFFEALLEGRRFDEAPDITARICGICPVAYQMSACRAMEDACGVAVSEPVAALRRLLYCGEWIQSHALHVYLLHAPDFLGCQDAVELAGIDRAAVERGLDMKRTGNRVMQTVGGRAVHPVNVRVGGFYRAPDTDAVRALADPLRQARDDALATVSWVAGFDFPDVTADYRYVALTHPDRYPIDDGRVAIGPGTGAAAAGTAAPGTAAHGTQGPATLSPAEFADVAVEEHVARSTALQARLEGRPYLTGPLARYALNAGHLPPVAREAATAAGLGPVCDNPFKSIIVRAVELVFACDEALRLVEAYERFEPAADAVPARAGIGTGATEAPRGLLVHRYEIGDDGLIRTARIMPPTSQNQLTIEDDLRRVVEGAMDLSDEDLTWRCEQAVRNHDPCISCAAHFLDVTVDRS